MVKAYQPLGDTKVSEIARAYYEKRAAQTKPQNEPVMVLIGAQPGAGKSRAAAMMRAELSKRGGYIHVDADRMREEINTRGARPSSKETQADAGKLAQALRAQAMTGRRNVLEEGTFRDSRLAAEFIETVKKDGYRMELVAVATPREESLLGIYQRYEYQHQTNVDNPRFVEESYHDAAMGGFERNLAENAGRFARVRIVNRDCQVLFDSARQPGLSAIEALKDAQRLDGKRLATIAESWRHVREQAEGRGADAPYLQAVRRHEERTATMRDLTDSAQNVDLGRQGKEQTKAQSKTLTKEEYGVALNHFLEQRKNEPGMNPQKLAEIRAGIEKAIDEKVGKHPTGKSLAPKKSKDEPELER